MKPITLFTRPASFVYKHSICSSAALLVLVLTIITVLAPFYIPLSLNGDVWMTQNQHRIELMQPVVSFPFRYILIGEFRSSGDALAPMVVAEDDDLTDNQGDDTDPFKENTTDRTDPHIRAFTSYSFLNELMSNQQHSVSIKQWTTDVNYDGRADQINLQFAFEHPQNADSMSFISLYLDLEAHLTSAQSCSLRIPTALTIDRLSLPTNEVPPGTELHLEGRLRFQQRSSFNCPNILRNRQTFFQRLNLIEPNSTCLEDYSITSIANALRTNVGYLDFESTKDGVNWQAMSDPQFDQHIRLNVVIHIDEVEVRYWTSFGQQAFRMWMEYLAVLVVFVTVVNWIKSFMFSRMWLRTWEVQSWKQKTN